MRGLTQHNSALDWQQWFKAMSYISGQNDSSVWTLRGNQGQNWQNGQAPIPRVSQDYSIVFEGVRGSFATGDIAIDDISFTESSCGGEGGWNRGIVSSVCLFNMILGLLIAVWGSFTTGDNTLDNISITESSCWGERGWNRGGIFSACLFNMALGLLLSVRGSFTTGNITIDDISFTESSCGGERGVYYLQHVFLTWYWDYCCLCGWLVISVDSLMCSWKCAYIYVQIFVKCEEGNLLCFRCKLKCKKNHSIFDLLWKKQLRVVASFYFQSYQQKQHLPPQFPHLSHILLPPPPPTPAPSTAASSPACVGGVRTSGTSLTGQGSMEQPAQAGQDPLAITHRQTTVSRTLYHYLSVVLITPLPQVVLHL